MLSLYRRIFPAAVQTEEPSAPPPILRLRLTIRRHELPVTKILFSHTSPTAPISKLLDAVNDSVPLEADGWGLEDYVVTVAGFECLHYHPAASVLCEDDEVEIRALGSEDVKARHVGGRYQISKAGVRLVDGLPFGRSKLKRVSRPAVRIPPLKKRRLLVDEDEEEARYELLEEEELEEGQGGIKQWRITSGFDDADVEEDETPDNITDTVGFKPRADPDADSDHDNDSDSEDFEPDEDDDSDSEDHSELNDDDADEDEITPVNAAPNPDISEASSSPFTSSSEVSADDDSSPNTGGKDKDVKSDISITLQEGPEELSSTQDGHSITQAVQTLSKVEDADEKPVAPGQGKTATRKRNERRVKARLRHKEEAQQMAQRGATLREDDERPVSVTTTQGRSTASNKTLFDADGNAEAAESVAASESQSHALEAELATSILTQKSIDTPGRRKLDLAASQRLVFGSLGVRRPKTAAEAEKVSAQLSGDSKKKTGSPNTMVESSRVDAWKTKLNLRAVETVDEGITLSTPPFPFVQRWDPHQQYKPQSGKKRKRQQQIYYDGDYDKEQDWEVTAQGLNYDEDSEMQGPDVDTSLPVGRVVSDLQIEEDLPLVPRSIEELNVLTIDQCTPGTMIVFKRLEISMDKNFGPGISPIRTAILESNENGWLSLTLALRDCPHKQTQYDAEGNRVYGRFEAPVDDEDEAEDAESRNVELDFDDLIDPRILAAAPASDTAKQSVTQHANDNSIESQHNSLSINGIVHGSTSQPAQPRTIPSGSESQQSSGTSKQYPDMNGNGRFQYLLSRPEAAGLGETDYGTLNMDDLEGDEEDEESIDRRVFHSAVRASAG